MAINGVYGTPSIPTVTASGTVTQTYKPSGTPSLDTLTASGTAVHADKIASGTPSLETITASATGNSTGPRTATGTPSIPGITATSVAIGPPVEEEERPAGGYGALNWYDGYRQKKRKRKKELEKAIAEIEDEVDRLIAIELHKDLETERHEQELAELEALISETYSEAQLAAAQAISNRVAKAYTRAALQGNYSAIEAFEREMERAREEEEFLLLAMALLG